MLTALNPNKNSIANETLSSIKDESMKSFNNEIERKCYENLMDVCRGLAASLDINISDIMPIQVSL